MSSYCGFHYLYYRNNSAYERCRTFDTNTPEAGRLFCACARLNAVRVLVCASFATRSYHMAKRHDSALHSHRKVPYDGPVIVALAMMTGRSVAGFNHSAAAAAESQTLPWWCNWPSEL